MTDKDIQKYRFKTVVSAGILTMLGVLGGVLAMWKEYEIVIHMGVGLLICMVVFMGMGELAVLLMRIIQLLEEGGKK